MLDLVDEHPRAVQYDLLKHGYRQEWIGTELLSWGDALAILTEQPASTSAVYRVLHPDDYDRDKKLDRLEAIAVLIVRGQHLLGKQVEVDDSKLPNTWDDLWEATPREPETPLMSFDEIDARMGWFSQPPPAPIELLSTDEIDERMGW